MAALDDKRFLIVTGKGGVGKTTVCAAEALALAARGKRVLVAMCNAKERLSAMLGSDLVGNQVVSVAPERLGREHGPRDRARGVRAHDVEVAGALQAALRQQVRAHVLPRRARDGGVGDARQGVVAHDRERGRRSARASTSSSSTRRRRATGSTCSACRRSSWTSCRPGLLRRDAERAWAMFQDPALCAVVLVTLPEEMPTTETIELAHALRTS